MRRDRPFAPTELESALAGAGIELDRASTHDDDDGWWGAIAALDNGPLATPDGEALLTLPTIASAFFTAYPCCSSAQYTPRSVYTPAFGVSLPPGGVAVRPPRVPNTALGPSATARDSASTGDTNPPVRPSFGMITSESRGVEPADLN